MRDFTSALVTASTPWSPLLPLARDPCSHLDQIYCPSPYVLPRLFPFFGAGAREVSVEDFVARTRRRRSRSIFWYFGGHRRAQLESSARRGQAEHPAPSARRAGRRRPSWRRCRGISFRARPHGGSVSRIECRQFETRLETAHRMKKFAVLQSRRTDWAA